MELEHIEKCDILTHVKTGDLLAWSHSPGDHESIWINLVRLMTMSEFGHVSIAWQKDDDLYHVEAVIPRIRVRKIPTDKSFYIVRLSKLLPVDVDMSFFADKIDLRYSIVDAIRAYLGITTIHDDKYQCAELANDFYKSVGIDLKCRSLTPSNIVRSAMELTDLQKLKPCIINNH